MPSALLRDAVLGNDQALSPEWSGQCQNLDSCELTNPLTDKLKRLSKLFSLGTRQETPPPIEPAAVAAAGSQFSLDSLDERDDPAEKTSGDEANSVLQALDAELVSKSQKTVVEEEEQTPRESSEKSSQKTESVTKSNERNVRGKQCAVVEKSQLVVAKVSPVEPEFDQTSSTTTTPTTLSVVTSVPVAMTSALERGFSELPCVTAASAKERISDSANCPNQPSVPDSFEKRKRNKRSRRRKSSGGKVHAQAAGEPSPISEALSGTEELTTQSDPAVNMGIGESVLPVSDSEGSSPRNTVEPSSDPGSRVDMLDEGGVPCGTEAGKSDAPSASGETFDDGIVPEKEIQESNLPAGTQVHPKDIVTDDVAKPSDSDQNSPPRPKPPPEDDSQTREETIRTESSIPMIRGSDVDEYVGHEIQAQIKGLDSREKMAVQRILEFSEDGEIEIAIAADSLELRSEPQCESAVDGQVIDDARRVKTGDISEPGPSHETAAPSNFATVDHSFGNETVLRVYDQDTTKKPDNLEEISGKCIIEQSSESSIESSAITNAECRASSSIMGGPCSEGSSPSVDRSSIEVDILMNPSDENANESSEAHCAKPDQDPVKIASDTSDPAGARSEASGKVTIPAAQESKLKDTPSVSRQKVAVPELAENCGLFVPLDGGVPQHPGQSHKTRQRLSRSPDYRNEAHRKLQEHRKFKNQLPVSQRPSKKLREECSMTSPVPGDAYDMDSLNTTVDSISPDSSFAQDLTYDIVDDEPRKPHKKIFTFGLEAAEAALKPKIASRARKPSEESPSLASEEESDAQGYPGSAALQLSVNISNGSNDSLAPCSINVEDLVRSQDSATDLLSFSYVPGSHKIFVPSENVTQRQQALRVVVSSRVESFDEPVDSHSSYIRSPRLETWGRKPAAIVSPMRTPALSKAVQTQSLPNFDSDEPSSRVVQGLRSALATYEQVVSVLKRKLDDFSKNNTTSAEALAKELVVEKSNNQKLEHTVNTLENAVQSTMLRMGEVRSANSELREVVQSQLDTLTQYKSQIEDLHFEKDQLKASHEGYVAQCEERIRREKHSFEKQAALMRAQMEMKNMELDRLQHEAKIMRDQLAACQKVINDLQQY